MKEAMLEQIMTLKNASISELQKKHSELFNGKKVPSNNKVYLWRKIAYRIQELEYGSVSAKTQDKIQELITKYDPVNNKSLRPDNASDNHVKKLIGDSEIKRGLGEIYSAFC